jgi:Protein of unknown function (DUF1091)
MIVTDSKAKHYFEIWTNWLLFQYCNCQWNYGIAGSWCNQSVFHILEIFEECQRPVARCVLLTVTTRQNIKFTSFSFKVEIDLFYHQNRVFQRALPKITVELCALFSNGNQNPLVKMLVQEIRKTSDFPLKCPVKAVNVQFLIFNLWSLFHEINRRETTLLRTWNPNHTFSQWFCHRIDFGLTCTWKMAKFCASICPFIMCLWRKIKVLLVKM